MRGQEATRILRTSLIAYSSQVERNNNIQQFVSFRESGSFMVPCSVRICSVKFVKHAKSLCAHEVLLQ